MLRTSQDIPIHSGYKHTGRQTLKKDGIVCFAVLVVVVYIETKTRVKQSGGGGGSAGPILSNVNNVPFSQKQIRIS